MPARCLFDPLPPGDRWLGVSTTPRAASGTVSTPAACLKGVVTERDQLRLSFRPRPRPAWQRSVIYELQCGWASAWGGAAHRPAERKGACWAPDRHLPYCAASVHQPWSCCSGENGLRSQDAPPAATTTGATAPELEWAPIRANLVRRTIQLEARQQVRGLVTLSTGGWRWLLDVVYNTRPSEGQPERSTLSWRGFATPLLQQNESSELPGRHRCGTRSRANRRWCGRPDAIESMRCCGPGGWA